MAEEKTLLNPMATKSSSPYPSATEMTPISTMNITKLPSPYPSANQAMTKLIQPKPKNDMMMTPQPEIINVIAPIKNRLERGESRHLSATSEESVMVNHIENIHSSEGIEYDYDSKYVLNIIEEIILRLSIIIPGAEEKHGIQERLAELEREATIIGFTDLREDLAYPINKIYSELICHCRAGGDGRKVTEELFQSLAQYSWDAKVVIAFAAFALHYGEFWLVAQLYRSNPLARSVSQLMEVPEIMENTNDFRSRFKAITDLVNLMLDVTKSMFEFNELLSKHYIAPDASEKLAAGAHFSVAAYWTVRGIVACVSILTNLMVMGYKCMSQAMETWQMSTLGYKLVKIKDNLHEQKYEYQLKLEEKRQNEAFWALKRLFEVSHLDNMKILRALIYLKDDMLPIYDGSYKKETRLDVLRNKTVAILISGLVIPPQEFHVLLQLYNESRDPSISHENRFEIVWLPIIDRTIPLTDEMLQQYGRVQEDMPWYSISHPKVIDPAAIRFIREEWKYEHKPMLVVLDPQGKVSNYNAINMYWIWGGLAFPFNEMREEALWREASWNMELLVNFIDPSVHRWLSRGKFICVYGGGDITWIRNFTRKAKNIARELNIDLELLYVGKATEKEKVRKNNEIILAENLSSILPDFMWFFWARLNCMWNSKEKQGMSLESDEKMKQIIHILTYDSSDIEWAVFSRGMNEITKARGDIMLDCLNDFSNWKERIINSQEFVLVLNEQLHGRYPEYHCSRLFYPGTAGRGPHTVDCPECGKHMDKYLMYRCCTG